MKLMIVESPNKTKKIGQYLGNDWIVAASFGHIRDLPLHEIGVSTPDYQPAYEVVERGKKQVNKLKELAKKADELWLATDPDREGEAISWHLYELLGKGKTVKRITFNEITESAIKNAVTNPRDIDMNLVMAQQGRRVLDRLYGYKISPALSARLTETGISAGRVQSIALMLIVQRERDIRAFKPTQHYGITALFNSEGQQWKAQWQSNDFVTDDSPYILDKLCAEKVREAATHGLIVTAYQEQERKRKPAAPLITSTLQQAAANKLNMSVGDTMKAAQKLFEAGYITYMRTDNPNLSDEAIAALHDFLNSIGQSAQIADKPNKWKAKDDAQEAHEAIRPTDFAVKEADVDDEQAQALYQLIRRVAIACQMKDAIYSVRTVELTTTEAITLDNVPNPKSAPLKFTATASVLRYKGWQIMADDFTDEDEIERQSSLPELSENTILTPNDTCIDELETKAPKRYSETALVKALEREGIGRPATYANIIETQIKRNYAQLEKRVFVPTKFGESVVSALEHHFSIMKTTYTAEMESKLDEIARGKMTYRDVVAHYDEVLDNELSAFQQANIKTFGDKTSYPCPKCKTGNLRRIKGKNGFFWGCSNYNTVQPCDYIAFDDKGKPAKPREINTNYPCPECGSGYLQRYPSKKDKTKYWWGCSEYKNGCKYKTFDDNGKPKK